MIYLETIEYLNSFANYEKNTKYSYKKTVKLERVRDFLSLIGNPQKFLRVIHVAGTKGKGSACAFVAYILREAGFSVGLYTSPHLNDFRERIRLLRPLVYNSRRKVEDFEGMIPQKDLSCLAEELKLIINKYNRYSKYGPLTFFEVYSALAFLYFKRKQVDFVVLETGLGGRLDATNCADSLVCAITPISFEHVQKLGKTLAKIAAEKSGIIKKNGAIVISAVQEKEARRVIQNRCKKFQASLYEIGKQIKYYKKDGSFTIKGIRKTYKNLRLKLLGTHQIANAALAVGLVEILGSYGFDIKEKAIRLGLYNTVWPGRCEIIGKNPLIILDGAQNLASAKVLRKAIKEKFSATSRGGSLPVRQAGASGGKYRKLILVLGISDDKDICGICKTLDPLADEIILTCAATPRAASLKKLSACFKRKLYLTKSVKEAKLLAKKLAHKKDLILVTGSLFVVGEFRSA